MTSSRPPTDSLGKVFSNSKNLAGTRVIGFQVKKSQSNPTNPTPRRDGNPLPKKDDTDSRPQSSGLRTLADMRSRKPPICFMLGASHSSSEEGQSPEPHIPDPTPDLRTSKLKFGPPEQGGSLISASLPQISNRLTTQKKQASFSNHVNMHSNGPDNAIDSDSEGDYIDESAIDEEDDSDWVDDSRSSVDGKDFQRTGSVAKLTEEPSLLTLLLQDADRKSQSTKDVSKRSKDCNRLPSTPDESDDSPLMMNDNHQAPLKPIRDIPRSSAQPIPAGAQDHDQAVLSPRTTRRNMLATELTESLRRHLLWERSWKTLTANAVLKRRHTSHDLANLKQLPEKSRMRETETEDGKLCHQYDIEELFDGYNSKGW